MSVLAGHRGIAEVSSGWLGPEEVNRVRFDPEQVSVAEMERWLRRAGTYLRTVEQEERGAGVGEE